MINLLEKNLAELEDICRRRQVRRLAVFGSASRDDFVPETSDIDLIVDFLPMPPRQHADCYFNLLSDLENLLGFPVDLVEEEPIKNPFFKQEIEVTEVQLYEAA